MSAKHSQAMTRRRLLAEIQRLHSLLQDDNRLLTVVHDLEVHREELQTQHAQLIEAQRQLEASRDRYADLFDFAPIPYLLLDDNAVIQDINLVAAQLLGAERSRLVAFPFYGFVETASRRIFLDYVARCRREPGTVDLELTLASRTGRHIPVQITTKRALPLPQGPARFHMAIVDLTDRKTAEGERLRIARENQDIVRREQVARAGSEAKDRFLAVLSHELRTPLTPILLALAAAERAGRIPQEIAPTIAMIKRNVELEARLIDDLLDVTRITQGLRLRSDVVDMHAVAEEAIALSREELATSGLTVSLELAAASRHVRGDAARLLQVLRNLISNAIHHGGGDVIIRSANPEPGSVRLAVSDSGAGIEPPMLERLFLPFEQGTERGGRSAGLGLGLAICRAIMEAHGGTIGADSAGSGRGSTFTLDLSTVPAESAPVHAASAYPHDEMPPPSGASPRPRILLVEDNHDNAEAIAALLRVDGYEVDVADSVASALRKADDGFDILVSDIGLPDGSGRDLMRQLCGQRPVRGIALTGFGTDQDVRLDTDAGFAAHLTKPVDPEQLLTTVRDFARQPPRRDAGSRAGIRPRGAGARSR